MYTRFPAHLVRAGRPDAVLRDADRAMITQDDGNVDWLAYRAWLDDGNAPAEPSPEPARPRTIEGRLLVKALTDAQGARVKLRDLLRIAGDQNIPETNGAVIRVAGTLGLDVPVWFDAASAP